MRPGNVFRSRSATRCGWRVLMRSWIQDDANHAQRNSACNHAGQNAKANQDHRAVRAHSPIVAAWPFPSTNFGTRVDLEGPDGTGRGEVQPGRRERWLDLDYGGVPRGTCKRFKLTRHQSNSRVGGGRNKRSPSHPEKSKGYLLATGSGGETQIQRLVTDHRNHTSQNEKRLLTFLVARTRSLRPSRFP